jgi:pimeloyl-ACP methyl ester carboxylesterase
MESLFCVSKDKTFIAYDVTGTGPALVILHGIGKNRKDWHDFRYIEKLKKDFTVITIDLRGNGESELRLQIEDYEIEKICDDIISVIDQCGINKFSVWGYSFGANVSRYLGAWFTDQIQSMVIVGAPFGFAVNDELGLYIDDFIKKYGKMAEAYKKGNQADRPKKSKIKNQIPAYVACFQAMKKWPKVEYQDIKCPALLLFGDKNKMMMNWFNQNLDIQNAGNIDVKIIEGINHQQEFSQTDKVFPIINSFLKLKT